MKGQKGTPREWVPSGAGRINFTVPGQVYSIDTHLDAGLFNTRFAKFGPTITRVTPAAGLVPTFSLAPGSLVSIYGFGLTQGQQQTAGSPWPTELAGTAVGVNGKRVPVFYAGPNQINAYLPEDLSGLVKLGVWNESGSHIVNVLIEDAVPALFSKNGTGSGPAAATNAVTGQLVGPEQPVKAGDAVSIFDTGMGRTTVGGGLSWTDSWPTVLLGGSPG